MRTTSPRPFFTPWRPASFNGTLILTESCPKGNENQAITGWRVHPDAEWRRRFIVRHVRVKREQDDGTFRALRQSFLYDGAVLEAFEFWERHGFTNLIPRLMGGGGPRPTPDDWRDAREQFPLILSCVRPQRVLIASA